jgi:DNA-directed RNA polymerase beta' subunit
MTERFDEITNIDRIEFTLYGNGEIKRASAINDTYGINIAETYDLMEPKRGGLVDPRLGTADSTILCATCGLEYKNCPGHFGHTELAEPVYHLGFLGTIKNILGCVCIRCSKLLINKSIDEINTVIRNKYGKVRFAEIRKLTSGIKYCQRQDYACGSPVPIITKKLSATSGIIQLQAETELTGVTEEEGGSDTGKKRVIEVLKPKIIYNIMKNISDLDYQIMGFDTAKARPEDMIIINFPIPPIAIRPPAKRDFLSTTAFEDTLTHKLADIVKSNIKVRKILDKESSANTGEDVKYSEDYIRNLQYHIGTYYNNEDINLPTSQQKTGGRPTKSIAERISGKTGRIRQNLNGKRVEGSGRAVITSDPSIGIDEVGIPLKIAMSIPFPEVVTPENYENLNKLVKNGRDVYPGIIKIIKKNGVVYDVRYRSRPIKLQYGDVVERHLINGDYVLFNRQPSLHKLSMMGHRVVVTMNNKFSTFRMNPSACKPYNADFDGDEMNIFVPQTIQSVVELSMLANVTNLIISPRNTEPIIELRQDGVLGSYLFTESDQKLTWNRVMKTLMNTLNIDITNVEKSPSSTYELMSYLIPNINLTTGKINVENGEYKSGKVNQGILNNANGFLGTIYDQYGGEKTRDFIDNLQKVILSWLHKKGFSVGLKDCIVDNKILSNIKDKTNKLMIEIKHLITEQENHPGLLDESIFEDNVGTMLSAHAGNMGKIVMDSINSSNNFFVMVDSGAKGKLEQLGSVSSLVGQTNMNNKRIAKKVNNRTLPHFHQFDDTPTARGFISSSYIKGLRPTEFFFHQMAGRDGLIDTAIKSVTGDTPIIIYENKSKYVMIGDWIDNLLNLNKDKVQHFEEREMEYLELDQKMYIPTTDADGNVTWGEITAVTRHLPGKELYEIKTKSGKKVIVTESKALLIYNHDKKQFLHTATPDVKPGDFVPVTMKLPKLPNEIKLINLNEIDYLNLKLESCLELLSSDQQTILTFLSNININNIIDTQIRDVIIMLQNITNTFSSSFSSQNDVILDEIIEINKIDVALYPKVYDLTIPSTLNFGLANGLHVVDTADTGYVQRKLIKGMEDVMITYDGLVRSANNQILQYFYGGSNLDQVKQKEVKINLITLDNEKVRSTHVFSKSELTSMFKKSKGDNNKLNEEYYKQLIEFRDELRKIVVKCKSNYVTFQDKFMLPVNLFRIINSNKDMKETKSDLEISDIMETIEEIMLSENTKLFCMLDAERKKESHKLRKEIEDVNKYLFMISVYEYLSPRRCILDYKFTKKTLEKVKKEIISAFNKAIVDPGEMVGILGAQSMGERTTQLNLNTKHSAGAVKKGTQGVTRMNEILRCTKNIKTPILTIYLEDEYKYDKESAYKIASYIGYLTLRDIVTKSDIGYDPDIQNGYIEMDKIDAKTALQIYDVKLELKKLPWMFRFTINREMLYAKKLRLTEIKMNFVKFWRDKLNNTKNISKMEKDIFNRIVCCAIVSSNENDPNAVIHIRFEMNNYDINKMIEIQDYILSYFNLKGLDGVTSIDVISQSQFEIKENGEIENKDQYILQTDGINMSGIRGIKGIDHIRTITNDMYSIYANFGVEAVRNALINEISELITNVNYHHIALLIDVMTHAGGLISIDRHGINRQDTDPLSRASFEKTMEQFLNAAAFNETDKLKSVSSRIIIGRMINGGTGYCQLMMDNDILENTELNVSSIEQGLNETDVIMKLEENAVINDLIEKDSNIFIV